MHVKSTDIIFIPSQLDVSFRHHLRERMHDVQVTMTAYILNTAEKQRFRPCVVKQHHNDNITLTLKRQKKQEEKWERRTKKSDNLLQEDLTDRARLVEPTCVAAGYVSAETLDGGTSNAMPGMNV